MKEQGFEVLMISSEGKEWKEIAEGEECKYQIVPLTRRITPIIDLICLIRLIRIFKKERPSIVHTHTPKAGLLGMLAAKITGVEMRIHTIAGLPLMVETGLKKFILQITEKITSWSATEVWPNSYSMKEYMLGEKLVRKEKVKIIGKGSTNGIDISRFSKKNLKSEILLKVGESIRFSKIATRLLFIGRMVKDKGIEELIEVFGKIEKTYNIQLILIGPYEIDLDPISEEARNVIKHNENIQHISWSDNVEYYMSIADIFIFPSHREGFPNVLLQAGAMDLPIVCSDIPGNIDIIKEAETGKLFKVGDKQSLEEDIIFAINNREEMLRRAGILKEIVRKNFKREYIWEEILKHYKGL
jgi:glycosyltransferase involved in cell wall biosynthesis